LTVQHAHTREYRRDGLGLIELLVALVIGLVLVVGAVTLHQRSSAVARTAETVARLQEVARLAFDVLEADVRMAGFWGLHNRADFIVNRAASGTSLPAPFTATQGARIDLCGGTGSNWAIDLDAYIDGSNNAYGWPCAAVGGAAAGSDTLVVRRAAADRLSSLEADRIFVQSSRLEGALFVAAASCLSATDPACIPALYWPATSQSRELVVHAYYVSQQSTQRADLPALRRKSFGNVNAGAVANAISDEEIVAGVEDLQVRFGVDSDGDANVDMYADPGAVPAGASVMSATFWLRIRAEEREVGFVDGVAYQYADMTAPLTLGDNYRRLVVAKTIQLRNARS
jgi:type IV pilus assembly protein PilW